MADRQGADGGLAVAPDVEEGGALGRADPLVGVPGVIQQVIDGAPADARVVIVGVCMQTDQFEPFFGIVKQLNLQFVLGYTGEEFAASLDHIADGRIDVTPLITGYVGLGGVKGAFAELANPEQHAKVMVEPWS